VPLPGGTFHAQCGFVFREAALAPGEPEVLGEPASRCRARAERNEVAPSARPGEAAWLLSPLAPIIGPLLATFVMKTLGGRKNLREKYYF
jgi:hypothetical protein